MTDLESDKKYIADNKLRTALRIADPYDGPCIDYERTYTIGAVVQELKVREEALRVLAAAYRAERERANRAEARERQLLDQNVTIVQMLKAPTPVRLEPGEWS